MDILGGSIIQPLTPPLLEPQFLNAGAIAGVPLLVRVWGLAIGKAQGHLKVINSAVSQSLGCRHLLLLGLRHNTIPPCCCGLISTAAEPSCEDSGESQRENSGKA